MGRECGIYGGGEICIEDFGGGHLKEKDLLENLGIDGGIILKWIFYK